MEKNRHFIEDNAEHVDRYAYFVEHLWTDVRDDRGSPSVLPLKLTYSGKEAGFIFGLYGRNAAQTIKKKGVERLKGKKPFFGIWDLALAFARERGEQASPYLSRGEGNQTPYDAIRGPGDATGSIARSSEESRNLAGVWSYEEGADAMGISVSDFAGHVLAGRLSAQRGDPPHVFGASVLDLMRQLGARMIEILAIKSQVARVEKDECGQDRVVALGERAFPTAVRYQNRILHLDHLEDGWVFDVSQNLIESDASVEDEIFVLERRVVYPGQDYYPEVL